MQGLLLIDKPSGISSFRVVSRVRGIIRAQTNQKLKVGHSGTLDPMPTGLLLLAIGAHTKKLAELIKQDKTYEVTMYLGKVSTTGDSEGEVNDSSDIVPKKSQIKEVMKDFTGLIMQTPPIYSAIKINGQRAYDLARKGKQVKIEPRQVEIKSIKLTDYEYPLVKFTAEVSSGTYIRSLVQDMGSQLGSGAYMSDLRRTKIGPYKLEDAVVLDDLDYSKIEQHLFTLDK